MTARRFFVEAWDRELQKIVMFEVDSADMIRSEALCGARGHPDMGDGLKTIGSE